MKMKKQSVAILLIVFFLLGGALTFGGIKLLDSGITGGAVKISSAEYKYYKQLNKRYGKLNTLYDEINTKFYKETNKQNLDTGMYKGLIAGLGDPYSAYMTKDEYDAWTASTLGEFDGIGITFSANKDGAFVIISVIPGTPAEKVGMKPGDLILAVDGKVYTDMEAAGGAMRGKAGTKVKVTYFRDGKETTETLTRAKIVNESVTSKVLKDNIGYIRISGFEEHTADDFKTELEGMEAKGVEGLIIDLRQNGGGLVDSGVKIADLLLGEGTITYLQDRAGNKKNYNSDEKATKLPYVLLVDGGTASTSEIVAAAVKDDGSNKIVGIKTFGKGIVQTTETLTDGAALKLTTMQYFSPKGRQINEKGVAPDYVVKNSKNGKGDKQLAKAVELLK